MASIQPIFSILAGLLAWLPVAGFAQGFVPQESDMFRPAPGRYLRLVSPLTSAAGINRAGWHMEQLTVGAVAEPAPRLGATALRFGGRATAAGGKGDFDVSGTVPGEVDRLGHWVHLDAQANVARVGVQIVDAEGENFLIAQDVSGEGWRWVEYDLSADNIPQAWKQQDKNRRIDFPLRSVHIVWFSSGAGPSALTVNALVASTTENPGADATLAAPAVLETAQAFSLPVILSAGADQPVQAQVEYRLQRDPRLAEIVTPDPVHGTDHALGQPSWTIHDGKEIERGSLTGLSAKAAELPWGGKYTEATQFIDLGHSRRVTHLVYRSGDANWVWKLDVAASNDGQQWRDVPGLTDLDLHKKWGRRQIAVPTPFDARFVRLRYHNDQPSNALRLPASFSVYDGVADESWEFAQVGTTIASGQTAHDIPARAFAVVTVGNGAPLAPGAYLLSVRIRAGERTRLLNEHLYVMPEPIAPERQAQTRIALNSSDSSLAEIHRRLGIGWVRFENLKWRMASPGKGQTVYDGLPPWRVNHDRWIQQMRDQHIQVLPYLFLSPEWASSAPKDAKHREAWPPTDYDDYADFVFQTVARYGAKKHDPGVLSTADKLSGLNLLNVYELWNEPNLNDPGWGHWVGPINEYYEMFRRGAQAARRADPDARIANAGYAGITLALVDQLRTYTYADGKHPLDFVDVLSVHTYTGPQSPEKSAVDTNVDRSGNTQGSVSHEENLLRLVDWRDQYRPKMPIWMTETGYDVAGPRAVGERNQAAYNVRNALLMLGAGIEKVFIYREVGSSDGLYAASGLLRSGDHSQMPSWFAVATLIRQLGDAGAIHRLAAPDPQTYLYAWQRDGQWTIAAWSVGGEVPLGVALGSAQVVDAFGGVDRTDDTASVVLGDMPIYLSRIGDADAIAALVARSQGAHQQWRTQRRRLAEVRAYLFDFGGTEHVGSTDIGGLRAFVPVLAENTYDAKRGYGFQPGPAERDGDAKWIASPTLRDSTRVKGGQSFRMDVKPGRYELVVNFRPAGDDATASVAFGGGATQSVSFTRDQNEARMAIAAAGGSVMIAFSKSGDIRYITLIERTADQ